MNEHIVIGKLSLEVEIRSGAEFSHSEWPDRLREWLDADFLPKLEATLERQLAPFGNTVFLDRLDLDLGQSVSLDFEKNAHHNLDRLLSDDLVPTQADISKGKLRHITSHEREMEAFCFFLKTGMLPWWKSPVPDSISDWEQQLVASVSGASFGFRSLVVDLEDTSARKRLAGTFSTQFLQKLLSEMQAKKGVDFSEGSNAAQRVERLLSEDRHSLEAEWEKALLQMKSTSTKAESGNEITESLTASEVGEQADTDPIYIRNAGLVLLHPFLQMLLEELGLAREGRVGEPETALQVLHYLAVGRGGAEWELPLNKLLCGLSPWEVVTTKVRLTSKEQEECGRLLQAAIRHWSALGSTSPEGLQGTFLSRDGKLSRKDDGSWLLQVEQKGFDVLLADLPWGISMVKLPWMPEMLWVEWA